MLGAAALLGGGAVAHGQSIGVLLPLAVPGFAVAAGVSAQSRLHPENVPEGETLGILPHDLLIYPALAASLGYDGAPVAGQAGSAILQAQPSLRIEDAATGLIGFVAADLDRLPGAPVANATDITAGIGTALPLGPDTLTLGAARVGTRESALGLAQTGAAPFRVVVSDVRIADRRALGAFDGTMRFDVSHTGLRSTAGAPTAFTGETLIRASAALETADDGVVRWLVQAKASIARYQGAPAGSVFSNTTALALAGGFVTDRAAIVRLRLIAGGVHQASAHGAISAGITPVVSAGIGWTPDPLLSFDLEVTRRAGVGTSLGSPGTVVNTARLAIAQDYAPDLQFAAGIDARSGTVAGRHAREIDVSAGATWHVTRAVALEPALSYARRHNLPGSAGQEARIMVGLVWTP